MQLALIVTIGTILFSIESFIPTPMPWIKLGLANITTILALKWWNLKEAFIVVFMRVIIGSLLIGRFLHPTFIISLSGNIIAALTMYVTIIYGERIFSIVGISIIGAVFKNITQLFIVYFLYLRHLYIFSLIPFFLFSALVTGIIIGLITHLLFYKITLKIRMDN